MKRETSIRAGIIGVSGYAGGELARLLLGHPYIALTYATSNTYAGKALADALPGTRGISNLVCEQFSMEAATDRCDLLFLAGESGLAMRLVPDLLRSGKKIIDISADFRLQDPSAYATWYKREHECPELLPQAVYGLPEMNRDKIATAQLVANPGCYPTSAILALAPLLARDLVDPDSIIVDSHSGVSGAGRSSFGLDYHFAEVNESIRPYGVGGVHRHTPEIEQALSAAAHRPIILSFTPHLAPITRGILTTGYASLKQRDLPLTQIYKEHYQNEPFVQVLDQGSFPATKHVQMSNFCHIGVAKDERTGRAIAISAIDNLVKGAAGQAVQNMNLMCGFEENAGLNASAVWP